MVELLTEAQAAERAGVSKWTIRRLIDAGKLRAVNYGLGRKGNLLQTGKGERATYVCVVAAREPLPHHSLGRVIVCPVIDELNVALHTILTAGTSEDTWAQRDKSQKSKA